MTSRRGISKITLSIILVMVIGVTILSAEVYTTWNPNGNCPLVSHSASSIATAEGLPFALVPVDDFHPALDQGSGNVTWCIYNRSNGQLERAYATNRLIDLGPASANGQYVVVTGFQVPPGPAAGQTNLVTYLFNAQGKMLWSLPTVQDETEINGNGSVILANNPDLLYMNNDGTVLWNYTNFYDSFAVALVDDGSYVVDGINEVPYPNQSNFGSILALFDSHGQMVWNISIPEQQFDSGGSVAASNGYIAAGDSYSGWNGTLSYYNLAGALIWTKSVSSSIQQVSFVNDGSDIWAQTNYGNTTFSLTGQVIQNETYPAG